MKPVSVVLLSGGLDSATVLALAMRRTTVHTISFRYGQRHAVELVAAAALAARAGVASHRIFDLDFTRPGASSLTDLAMTVPTHDRADEIGDGIPNTYVPARNTIFLAYAVATAEMVGATEIHIGVNAVDYSGYPDCRPEFIDAFEQMANLATRAAVEGRRVRIEAPLLHLSKAAIINLGVELGVDFAATHSCYSPTTAGLACGHCDSCLLRRRGFQEACIPDPTRYGSPPADLA